MTYIFKAIMLDKTTIECLNTLRVESKSWSGFINYQGMTSKTALCPRDKSVLARQGPTSTTQSKDSLKKSTKSSTLTENQTFLKRKETVSDSGVERHLNSTMNDQGYEDDDSSNNNDDNGDDDKNHDSSSNSNDFSTRPQSAPIESSISSTSSSASPDRNNMTDNVRQPVKTSLALPSVSCNELPCDDEGVSEICTSLKSVNMIPFTTFTLNSQMRSRPHTAGPRVIVPPKHTCPEGLTMDDFIQGQGLGTEKRPKTSPGDVEGGNRKNISSENNGHHPNALHKTAPCPSNLYFKIRKYSHPAESSDIPCPQGKAERTQAFQLSRRPLTRCSAIEKNVPLELTITSITLVDAADSNIVNETQDDLDISSDSVVNEQQSRQKSLHLSDNRNQSPLLDTIEQIRKSYHRSQSAPPTHRRSHVVVGNPPDSAGNNEMKQFSNLYYRAKSNYHKRQETSPTEVPDMIKDKSQTLTSLKGSLLRPLLYANDQGTMKHEKGCPYKCKSCFKACLVSHDYVQKAIARAVLEQERHEQKRSRSASTSRGTSAIATNHSRCASGNIVNRALGRSQPLFHRVYGRHGGEVGRRTVTKPWPQYGWVDLTGRKEKQLENSNDQSNNAKNIKNSKKS